MSLREADQGQVATEMPPEVERLIEQVCRQIIEGLGATSCSLSEWDRIRNQVTTQITYARRPELEKPLHIEAGESYSLDDYPATARVLRERTVVTIRVDDPEADPAERALLVETGQQALLMAPLMIEDEVIGLLEVFQRERPRAFSPEEIARAWTLARQAAMVVEGGHLFTEARREARDLSALLEASTTILSNLDIDAVLPAVAEAMVRVIGVDGVTLSEYDAGADAVRTWVERIADHVSIWRMDQPGTTYALKDYPLTAKVLRERVAVIVQADDPQADPAERALMERLQLKSLLMLPMVAYNRVIGLVELMNSQHRREFTSREVTLAQTLTNQAATAIENARLYAQVQKQLGEMQRISESQNRLLSLVREVSTPVIPIHDRILVLPLIGVVDSGRARQFTESLLEAVRRHRALVVLVDITGVPLVDTSVAQGLLQTAEAGRLLGAEVVLVGVTAEVAQTMIALGLDMSGIVTKADLRAGIVYALGQLGLKIVPIQP